MSKANIEKTYQQVSSIHPPSSEPYVIYEGFKLGFGVSHESLAELERALLQYPQVVLLVEDTHFPSMLFSFLQTGEAGLESSISSRHAKKQSSFCLSTGNGAQSLMKSFFEERKANEKADIAVFERAKMQLSLLDSARSQLASSLPKSFSHPALNFIKKELELIIQEDIAPRLVDFQLKNWGLASGSSIYDENSANKLYAFSKRALENKVDRQQQ